MCIVSRACQSCLIGQALPDVRHWWRVQWKRRRLSLRCRVQFVFERVTGNMIYQTDSRRLGHHLLPTDGSFRRRYKDYWIAEAPTTNVTMPGSGAGGPTPVHRGASREATSWESINALGSTTDGPAQPSRQRTRLADHGSPTRSRPPPRLSRSRGAHSSRIC